MTWLTVLALAVSSIADIPNPRPDNRWISDTADVISPEAEARVEALIDGLHRDLGVEIAVVTVEQVTDTPKAFATELFNHWGIGDKDLNNGVLVLLVMGERRLEIETGYGMENQLPDGWLGLMQTERMVPHFKAGNFGAGIEAGLLQIDARLRGTPVADGTMPVSMPVPMPVNDPMYQDRPREDGGWPAWAIFLLVVGLGIPPLWLIYRFLRIRYHRRCGTCKIDRKKLDEHADDAHLDSGQVKEEELGSVNYHVYVCGQCSSTSVMADKAWFSGYSRCRKCRYRTMTVVSQTLEAATYDSSGRALITEDCKHCSHHHTRYETIPRLQRPSSSSSSGGGSFGGGGGSFGGGSSGGGGAGSSW